MMFQNYITIEGRLTRTPEVKQTSTGKDFVNFGICYNKLKKLSEPNDKGYNYESIPNFFNLTAWNKNAIECLNFKKGESVTVSGSLCYDEWNDKITNEKKSKVYILVNSIKKIVSEKSNYTKKNNDVSNEYNNYDTNYKTEYTTYEDKQYPDDIPF